MVDVAGRKLNRWWRWKSVSIPDPTYLLGVNTLHSFDRSFVGAELCCKSAKLQTRWMMGLLTIMIRIRQ